MIRYLIDTDVVSNAGKRKPNANLNIWLDSVDDHELAISAITVRERWEGAIKAELANAPAAAAISADVTRMVSSFEERILPIDEKVARRWAALLVPDRSKADDKGQAAIAAVHDITLVSLNAADMKNLGARVLNPGRKPPKLYSA